MPALRPLFFQEDAENIELYFLKGAEFVDYSGATVKLAVGVTQPAALQTSWTTLGTSIAASITSLVAGGSGSDEVQRISITPKPASGGWSIQFPARSVTVSSVSAGVFTAANHGLYSGQSVSLTAFSLTSSQVANGSSYFVIRNSKDTFGLAATAQTTTPLAAATTSGGGTAELGAITTGQLRHNATPQEAQASITAAGLTINGAPQIIVTGTAGQEYTLTYANGSARRNYENASVVGSTLAAPAGLSGTLSFNTQQIAALVAAGTTSVRLEIEVAQNGVRQTYSTTAELSNDIITSTSPLPAPVGNTVSTLNFNDGNGGIWAVSIDPAGLLTATKQ